MTAPEVVTTPVSKGTASMQRWRVETVTLLIAGLVLLGIGGATLLAPAAFHATSGIELGDSRSLLSETRAAGGSLLGSGVLIMLGAFASRLAFTATIVGAVTYVSYGLSRLLSMAVDGMPAQALVLATVVELVLGLSCVAALVWRRERRPKEERRMG
ncbi:DUF4345 domain-containing protein [Sorangium sp. So ce1036]|uniref:DUF4345 domain-containing protein n=1 Tax=Sorangium sp. So ce1036 TaxID=3133328 RepID=UPI003F01EB0C